MVAAEASAYLNDHVISYLWNLRHLRLRLRDQDIRSRGLLVIDSNHPWSNVTARPFGAAFEFLVP
jgi:hypothetical protein